MADLEAETRAPLSIPSSCTTARRHFSRADKADSITDSPFFAMTEESANTEVADDDDNDEAPADPSGNADEEIGTEDDNSSLISLTATSASRHIAIAADR